MQLHKCENGSQAQARNLLSARLAAVFAVASAFAAAAPASAATYRYAASSNRIYVEGGGTATLTSLKHNLPIAPLTLVDATNKIWMLSANLIVDQDTTLVMHGDSVGGDVNELRVRSANSGSNPFVYISAEPGTLDIASTKIRSWDPAINGPDANFGNGRAFVRVRSILDPDGVTKHESRMDIVDSEISYLGYNAAESYGLVWKVLGDPGPNYELYDLLNVYGNIENSHIHHNYYGVYTFGVEGGQWLNNEVVLNFGYGFDPHDDSDDLLIDSNNVHDNGYHGIIASKRCDHVTVSNNHTWNNAECGIMLHRSSNDGVISNNLSEKNGDCGISIFATARTTISNNHLLNNDLYGIRLSMGATDSQVDGNEMAGSSKYGVYFYMGTDTPEPGSDGRDKHNVFTNNDIHDIAADPIKLTDSDDNTFTGNTVTASGDTITIETTTNTLFTNNALPNNVTFNVSGTQPIQSVIKLTDQPRVTLQLDSYGSAQFIDPDAIYDTSLPIFTRVTPAPGGTLLDLDSTNFGDTATVYERDFHATVTTGAAHVNPVQWLRTGDLSKVWSLRVDTAGTQVNFVVGDLAPGVSYDVKRGPTKIKTLVATAAGRIAFNVKPASTTAHKYSVVPTP